jgi:hypothetical protein
MRGVEWILRAEAAAIFAVGAWLAFLVSPSPWLVLPLLLVPDVSMLGYLGGPRLGAITYNAAHNLVLPIVMLLLGWLFVTAPLVLAGAIVLAHVGMDRALGYGLKLPTDFRDTHLGRIGR